MELKNIVCSKEWAEKLKVAGWPQDVGLFSWASYQDDNGVKRWTIYFGHDKADWADEHYAAPTGTELGMVIVKGEYKTPRHLWGEGWYFGEHDGYFDSESDARAAQVCWMLEQKIITPEEIGRW